MIDKNFILKNETFPSGRAKRLPDWVDFLRAMFFAGSAERQASAQAAVRAGKVQNFHLPAFTCGLRNPSTRTANRRFIVKSAYCSLPIYFFFDILSSSYGANCFGIQKLDRPVSFAVSMSANG
jgi:hypothetical protein